MSVILDHAIMNIIPTAFINGWKDMIHVRAVGEMYSRDFGATTCTVSNYQSVIINSVILTKKNTVRRNKCLWINQSIHQ